MPYKYRKLKGRIVEKFDSQKEFCKVIDLSEVSVSKKLNGTVPFTQKDMVCWGEALDIPVEEYGSYYFT